MRSYIIRRFLYMIVILFAVSIVAFVIIQLPPGDWLTNQIMRSISIGQINEEQIVYWKGDMVWTYPCMLSTPSGCGICSMEILVDLSSSMSR